MIKCIYATDFHYNLEIYLKDITIFVAKTKLL